MIRRVISAVLLCVLCEPQAFTAQGGRPLPHVTAFAAAKRTTLKKPKPPRVVSLKELGKRIDKTLSEPELQRGFWGVHVVDVATGKTIYEVNADRLFTPASNTKLFTTATAFALLGPNYKVETTVETDGVLDPTGVLKGDLVLVGRGDPNLSGRVLPYNVTTERQPPHLLALDQLADALVAAGVKEIEGDVVGDDSLFAFERYGNGWGQDDLMWSDGAPASALTVNDNSIFVSVTPGETGGPAKITVDPDVSYYEIDNRILTTAARSGRREIGANREPGARTLSLWGSIPADDPGTGLGLAIDDPAEYAAAALQEMLAKRNVPVHGKHRAAHKLTADLPIYALDIDTVSQHGEHGGAEPAPLVTIPTRMVLARLESRPLSDDLVVINKVSQNLHAELVLRAIGRQRSDASSLEAALAAEQSFLTSVGLDKDEFRLFDGSGMSVHNVVTPRAVTKLLLWTNRQPWADAFRNTLPIGGVDGSLEDRFRASLARGRVWGKTGTLTHTNALSGFAETLSGRKLVFSILVNHHRLTSSGAKKVIDHLVELLVDDQVTRSKTNSFSAN